MKKILNVVIILSTILCLCMTTGCTEEKKAAKNEKAEIYTATASIIVTNGSVVTPYTETDDKISASDISASLYLAKTVVDILNLPDVYIELADELGDDYNAADLKEKIVVEQQSDESLIININVYSESTDEAILIANKFAQMSCEYVPNFFPTVVVKVASLATESKKSFLIK